MPGPEHAPTAIIVDASVLVAAVAEEARTEEVQRRLASVGGRLPLLVPSLARWEVLNALLRIERKERQRRDDARVRQALSMAMELTTQVVDPPGVLEVAAKHGLSAYDATYLALTLDSGPGARLWTLDKPLTKAAAAEGVLATAVVFRD